MKGESRLSKLSYDFASNATAGVLKFILTLLMRGSVSFEILVGGGEKGSGKAGELFQGSSKH